jgi:hypothetical protein
MIKGSEIGDGLHQFGGTVNRVRFVIFIMMGVILLAACNGAQDEALEMAPMSQLSPQVQQAPVSVQDAYRFALANPDLLQQIPCYCGCGGVGHTSNYACYVNAIQPDGGVEFDYHALG